jgi:site-specific DNA-methyltransferase (cytosine-N4-specific)
MSASQTVPLSPGEADRFVKPKFAIADELSAIDWNFSARKSHSDIEGLHPYPAKFVTELPSAILDTISVPKGSLVFDPFCGSGTTMVEAQKRGIASVGIDLNPIACLMTRVKTGPVPDGILVQLNEVLQKAQSFESVPIPEIPNLDHWFLKPVQRAVASIAAAIQNAEPMCVDIFRLALSSIIVRVSNQESDTRYAAIPKNVSEKDVYLAFLRAAQRTVEALRRRDHQLVSSTILEGDTLALNPDKIPGPVGLVITSPPYPNAYEYWLYHKYRMWWLGFDPLAVKAREIGARAHFFKRDHHTADDFGRQMAATFDLLKSVMLSGAYACFVVGRSKIHGQIVDNSLAIDSAAAAVGFERVFSVERVVSPHRKSFNLSHANIKTETVLFYRLEP